MNYCYWAIQDDDYSRYDYYMKPRKRKVNFCVWKQAYIHILNQALKQLWRVREFSWTI